MSITKDQIKMINIYINSNDLRDDKEKIILDATGGRTSSIRAMTAMEAHQFITHICRTALSTRADQDDNELRRERMARKVIAMAHEIGWIKKTQKVGKGGELVRVNDYSALNGWLLKFGIHKKPLNKYTYMELPALLTQFENGPYKHYLGKH